MKKLSTEKDWNNIYTENANLTQTTNNASPLKRLILKYTRPYAERLLWDYILPNHLPKNKDFKICEIGCAPGKDLLRFYTKFGYSPYGIDYSENGIRLTKQLMSKNNLNPQNITHADFLDSDFTKDNYEKFDIVTSRGFIEHFTEPQKIIKKHCELLKRNGYLVAIIPNLRGINYFLLLFFNKALLAKHNLTIMDQKAFQSVFEGHNLKPILCKYYGTFNFGLFNTAPGSFVKPIHQLLLRVQQIFNVLFHLTLRNKGAESRWFSPYLIYIGIKT